MDYENEHFVKIYTRDTARFLTLSWQARCLLSELARKVDRGGNLSVDSLGLRAVAVVVRGPWAELEGPVSELIEQGRLVFDAARGVISIPGHVEMQKARRSVAARKRDSRDRERLDSAPTEDAKTSVKTNLRSQEVTPGHVRSHPVTNVTLRLEEKRIEETRSEKETETSASADSEPPGADSGVFPVEEPSAADGALTLFRSPGELAPVAEMGPFREARSALARQRNASIYEVYEHWVARRQQVIPTARAPSLDRKRRGRIEARLREGYTVGDLCAAVDGMLQSGFNLEHGFDDIELCCRDATHVDRYMGIDRKAQAIAAGTGS